MAKSRKYIAEAIHECLQEHGDWIKIRDLKPLVCEKLGEQLSVNKIRGHITSYNVAWRRFDVKVYEYKL